MNAGRFVMQRVKPFGKPPLQRRSVSTLIPILEGNRDGRAISKRSTNNRALVLSGAVFGSARAGWRGEWNSLAWQKVGHELTILSEAWLHWYKKSQLVRAGFESFVRQMLFESLKAVYTRLRRRKKATLPRIAKTERWPGSGTAETVLKYQLSPGSK